MDAEHGTQPTPTRETGHPAVDEVLASLDGLGERPVSEHVEVFESAHDRLRAALSSDVEASAGGPAGPAGNPVPPALRPGPR